MLLSEAWVGQIIAFVKDHENLIPMIVFLISLSETIIIISILIPSTPLLFAIGLLVASAEIELVPSLLAGWMGASLGFSLMYLISASMKDRLLNSSFMNKRRAYVDKAVEFCRKWGIIGVFLGHFTGPLRVFVPIAAGISQLSPIPFMISNLLGAFMWILVFFMSGYLVAY